MNSLPTLEELHTRSNGKLSDKWDLYLEVYDQLLKSYRGKSVNILEIGVQNGGSLETWAQYFTNAINIIGCDINPQCRSLIFDDPRICVIVGDATKDSTINDILSRVDSFDIIIDDGSHSSSDIIASFTKLFPSLRTGGIYIAEDLHCCYWKEFEGGLSYPYSGIEFFKALCDCLNSAYWGLSGYTQNEYIESVCKHYGLSAYQDILDAVSSVEFYDSICVVRKTSSGKASRIKKRVIGGFEELVVPGHKGLSEAVPYLPQDHRNITSLAGLHSEYLRLSAKAEKLEEETNLLKSVNMTSSCTIIRIEEINDRLSSEIAKLETEVEAFTTSTSWKLTAPLRGFADTLKNIAKNMHSNIPRGPKSTDIQVSVKMDCGLAHAKPYWETATSFKVLSGGKDKLMNSSQQVDTSAVIAFYLPQYHRIRENDEWWGPGFTEWTNVVKGKENFKNHYQPHLPRELGFYDLSSVDILREQAEMAKLFGIDTFCFYYYWFSGRRVLERPINNFLNSDIDFKYCLCWANENWTRTWDGDTRSVLLEQKYNDEDPDEFIKSLLPYFEDSRYVSVDNKPVLVVYRAKDIPAVKSVFRKWRELVCSHGYPGLHIVAVDFYDIINPNEVEADALVEFPPHKFNSSANKPDHIPFFTNPSFNGCLIDYRKIISQSISRQRPSFTLYRGLIPSWDNTARRQDTPTIVYESNPDLFKDWLRYIRAYTRETFVNRSDNFIFINAWNEWGEGCHLEPDQKWGLAFLEAVKSTEWFSPNDDTVEMLMPILKAALEEYRMNNEKPNCSANLRRQMSTDYSTIFQLIALYAYKIKKRLKKMPTFQRVLASISLWINPKQQY